MDEKKARNLLSEYRTPKHIIKHCEKVAAVVKIIAEAYIKKGVEIDLNVLICAALLHDILRIVDIKGERYEKLCKKHSTYDKKIWDELKQKYKNMMHCDAAYTLLHKNGEEKIALMIKKHRFDAIIHPLDKPTTLEEKILTYADKRVLHGDVVSLQKRFEDGRERYNPENKNLGLENQIHDAYFNLEKEIFEKISLDPEDITEEALKNVV